MKKIGIDGTISESISPFDRKVELLNKFSKDKDIIQAFCNVNDSLETCQAIAETVFGREQMNDGNIVLKIYDALVEERDRLEDQ